MRTRPSYADIFRQNYKKNTIGIFKKNFIFFIFPLDNSACWLYILIISR